VITTSDPSDAVCAAHVKACAAAGKVSKGRKGQTGNQRYEYANISDVLVALHDALKGAGLSVVQSVDVQTMYTRVVHESGQWMQTTMPIHIGESGRMKGAKLWGSALTYHRRYALLALMGMAAEDDDGKAASQGRQGNDTPSQAMRISEAQVNRIIGLAKQLGDDTATLHRKVKEDWGCELAYLHTRDAASLITTLQGLVDGL